MKPLPSEMDRATFMQTFGALYEHSPWVAEAVFDAGLDAGHDRLEGLHQAFQEAVLDAGRERQLALLRAHPELAARRRDLTDHSRGEQAGAGLDQCTDAEFEAFHALNRRYRERFGFPFIVAVKGRDRAGILALFRERVERDAKTEFRAALEQVCAIGWHRLEAAWHD